MRRAALAFAAVIALAAPAIGQTSSSGTYKSTNNTNNSNTNVNGTTGTTSSDMNNTGTSTNTTNNNTTGSDMNNRSSGNLPRTAGPLPLVMLSGLGSLGAGLWLSRRRR